MDIRGESSSCVIKIERCAAIPFLITHLLCLHDDRVCSTLLTFDTRTRSNVVQLSSMAWNETKVCSSFCLLPQIYDPQITSWPNFFIFRFLVFFLGLQIVENQQTPKIKLFAIKFHSCSCLCHWNLRNFTKISIFCDCKSDECKISNFFNALVFFAESMQWIRKSVNDENNDLSDFSMQFSEFNGIRNLPRWVPPHWSLSHP